jgi:hypothetical protein
MLKLGYDTFVLVINFINPSWVPCHITVGLFKTPDVYGAVLIEQMKVLLVEFNLTNKIIAYVKDERTNLNSFTTILTFVVSCEFFAVTSTICWLLLWSCYVKGMSICHE